MEVICFALGIIIGAGAGAVCAYFIMRTDKKEAEIFEAKRREEEEYKNFQQGCMLELWYEIKL